MSGHCYSDQRCACRLDLGGIVELTQVCSAGTYSVARDDLYLRELLFEFVSPPPTLAPSTSHVLGGPSPSAPTSSADLMVMGFPQLVQATYPAICSCHHKLKSSGYSCPRCRSRICDVPTECKVCGLTVVNAPQLARSYRHLFPVRPLYLPLLLLPLTLSLAGLQLLSTLHAQRTSSSNLSLVRLPIPARTPHVGQSARRHLTVGPIRVSQVHSAVLLGVR